MSMPVLRGARVIRIRYAMQRAAAWEAPVLEIAASRLDREQTTQRLRKLLRKPRRRK